jgi:hypothetical protein
MSVQIVHPIIGDGYYPINDEALAVELAGAEIVESNDMFGAFTLIVGYRDPAYSADRRTREPFVCIKNHAPDLPHLFLTKE